MTHEELQAIKARAEAATPGPWTPGAGKISGETRELVIAPNDDVVVAIAYGGFGNPVDRTSQDRKFIAHARTDVPALVAEVERLRGALKRIASYPDADMFTSLAPAHDMRETARGALVSEDERIRLLREGSWDDVK